MHVKCPHSSNVFGHICLFHPLQIAAHFLSTEIQCSKTDVQVSNKVERRQGVIITVLKKVIDQVDLS